jgi:predicted glycoside hydrolase/deacetylase ChbG (UPF0249 family)
MSVNLEPAYLIVNADDYGYFHCVSRGILRSASHGIVRATGIFATGQHFDSHIARLHEYPMLDVGVHLNLTHGEPLTTDMRKKLHRHAGRFAGKLAAAISVLSKAIGPAEVTAEWRAQIERCLTKGLPIRFLNSHEHIHTLPHLFPVVRRLADEYGIAHVRLPRTDLLRIPFTAGTLFRSGVLKILQSLNSREHNVRAAHFLGLEQSGKLNFSYLEECVPRLQPGRIYELMCHPGHRDNSEVRDPALLRYHDWEGELSMLTSPQAKQLLANRNVQVIGYRDLEVRAGRLGLAHATG